MKIQFLFLSFILFGTGAISKGQELTTGKFFVTQSWSQEKDYKRPWYANVPDHSDKRRLPVLIFLHGNGGSAKAAMNGFLRRNRTIATKYITIFPEGYLKSWNIVSERSKADDRGFLEAIVTRVAESANAQPDDFTVMGSSNGAALANQLAIETTLPNIRNYITGVSPLNVFQFDGKNFRAKGGDNNYRAIAKPRPGIRLMNISGTDDRLIPYSGGPSPVIPAKDGNLGFVSAEESIFRWAQALGYEGPKLTEPIHKSGKLEIFSYLDGDVVHYKVNGAGHGATYAVDEQTLLVFLQRD